MNPWRDKRVIGNATLYLGDCLEILPHVGYADAVITDPPYGVGLEYESHTDKWEWVASHAVDIVKACRSVAPLVSITPGNENHYFYPRPTWTLCWLNRAGAGSSPWGFSCWQPILCYGPDPFLAAGQGRRPDFIEWGEAAEINGHPCPKPYQFMFRWIQRVAFDREIILDPFMGSGTTGAACVNFNKRFIGIEIEPKYFEIACERIENAQRQQRMFA